jgi:hypothetical protein
MADSDTINLLRDQIKNLNDNMMDRDKNLLSSIRELKEEQIRSYKSIDLKITAASLKISDIENKISDYEKDHKKKFQNFDDRLKPLELDMQKKRWFIALIVSVGTGLGALIGFISTILGIIK